MHGTELGVQTSHLPKDPPACRSRSSSGSGRRHTGMVNRSGGAQVTSTSKSGFSAVGVSVAQTGTR